MFEVIFLGVGEAFDENNPNTSILINVKERPNHSSILLDCGFSAISQFWRTVQDPNQLDMIWVSHFHGDHFLGIPPMLVRFWEDGRRKPLSIAGQEGIQDLIQRAIEISYPGFGKKIQYPLDYIEVEPGSNIEFKGLSLKFEENMHSKRDLAIRIDSGEKSIFYSGDGRCTPATKRLATGCSLLIHESFRMEEEIPGHGTVLGTMRMADETHASRVALVHIQRNERAKVINKLKPLMRSPIQYQIFVPECMNRIII